MKTNYFEPKTAAERYAAGRPDFHSKTIERIKKFLNLETNLDKTLDVACGTGLSTKALREISNAVFGTDISPAMLKYAERTDKISYLIANAEQQPFAADEFDLITVSSGIHWFEIDEFLREASRILKNNAWLIIYDNYFISEMPEGEKFSDWFPKVYLPKYPSPPRNNRFEWTNQNLNPKNLSLKMSDEFKNSVSFTKRKLIYYFTTQSNITAVVENGKTNYEAIESWLNRELSEFFPTEETERIVNFGNEIKFIQKT
jgi:ubiquinone/menaquinone biosynthesis C-methylase UbiE